ncbi:hypothetical protein JTB14_016893 [Gonioctena quinquepunctata]|nr:hypothetical protein JTB14_016893 [Gonioctena quinquepunctata]
MARYIIHNSDWVSIATISTQDAIRGYPFVTLKSLSDGPKTNSTGVLYLYITPMDVSGKDVQSDNRVTIMATLAQSDYCETENFDPQDPRCAKVLITGRLKKVDNSTSEYKFGLDSLFDRHPQMEKWPSYHHFYLAKVDIQQIEVLDYYGGLKPVTIEDYFDANVTNVVNYNRDFDNISVIDISNNNIEG